MMQQAGDKAQLFTMDVLEWACTYTGPPFHALFADCPYILADVNPTGASGNLGKRSDEQKEPRKTARKNGFMNTSWDGTGEDGLGVSMRPEVWKALAAHLYPGAFLFVFAGCLNDDLISVAMREAGLIREHSLLFVHGQGFPKATRIDTQIDVASGVAVQRGKAFNAAGKGIRAEEFRVNGRSGVHHAAKSALAQTWSGHRYGRQAIKPAVEVVLVFRKPHAGKSRVDCITRTGAGSLNIEAGRVGGDIVKTLPGNKFPGLYGKYQACLGDTHTGRWPSNFILESGAVAAELDRQSGTSCEKRSVIRNHGRNGKNIVYTTNKAGQFSSAYPGEGGASRFFHKTNWNAETVEILNNVAPFVYGRKARADAEKGLEEFDCVSAGSLSGGGGLNYTGKHAVARNTHPCRKSLALTTYLSKLILPPATYAPRRLLVPFSGSGSEMCGALLAGWETVVGVEMSEEYNAIAAARLAFWQNNVGLFESLSGSDPADPDTEPLALF